MMAKQIALAVLAATAISAKGDIAPSGDSSGATDVGAIQSAIDAAGSGGSVVLGAGTFYINTQLMVTNGVTLSGQGWDGTIIRQVASPGASSRVVTVSGGATVRRVTLTGGRVTGGNHQFGGGAYVDGGTVSWCCITNNTVYGNNVKFGGGVGFFQGSGGTVDHCVIADNSVGTSTANDLGGGGIGAYNPYVAITVDSCLIRGNRSCRPNGFGRGGGIGIDFMYRAVPVVVRNTTIVGNESGEGDVASYGGAVFTANDTQKKLSMVNCIVAGNTTAGASATMNLSHAGGVDYCLFDVAADLLGANSVTGEPKFASADDYALAADSPAKGAGATYEGLGVDLAGVGFGNPPSMGCYEYSNSSAEPTFDPVSGSTFYPSTTVTLACAMDGASIYYTVDGSEPTEASALYTGPFEISATTTVKARAYAQNMSPSAVVVATYVCQAPVQRPDGFRKCVDITLTSALSDSAVTTGLPALIRLSESAISGFDYDDFSLANGGDMMIVDGNGSVLPHEVDSWNADGESLVWVRLPSAAAGTTITLCYGNDSYSSAASADVWTDYVGVWHFDEATAATAANSYGTYANSTATEGIDGHVAQHTITGENGRFGKCFRVNDSDGWKSGNFNYGGVWVNDSGSDSPIDGGQNFTISGWFKHDQVNYYWDHFFYKRERSDNGTSGSYVNAFAIESDSGTGSNPTIKTRGSSNKGAVALSENQGLQNAWAYITFVFDGTVCSVYKNGAKTGWATIDACVDNNSPLVFGNNCNVAFGTMGDAAWNGWIDEVRFSKGSRSDAWVAAEYAAMNASETDIFSYGAVQDIASDPKVAKVLFSSQSGTTFSAPISVSLSCATEGAQIYYTLDESEPTEQSTLYTGPIAISATTTVKARAFAQDMVPSAVAVATYIYEAQLDPIVLGEAAAVPGAGYNGSTVSVSFAGDIPEGASVAASITIGGVAYAGTVDAANGVVTVNVPSDAVTAGNVYEGTLALTVGDEVYTAVVPIVQGTPKLDEDPAWVHESAATLGTTGSWSGDKAQAASGAIAVSNATFTAAKAAPNASVVTVSTTFRFGDPSDEAYDISSRAGITVVEVAGVNRYAVLTANGAVTNLSVVANTESAVEVTVVLDGSANTVAYSVGGASLGTYPMTAKATGVSTVRYVGATDVVSLDGAYRYEGLDSNIAKAGGVEYASVEAAVGSGASPVELLWDANWTPASEGAYVFRTNGHDLAVGGALAHSFADNGDGTVTVTVAAQTAPSGLRISEVGSAVANPWGDTTSFIEICNAGADAADLAGVTVKRYQKGKFGKVNIVFPSYTLAPGAYAVVWCSDDFGYDVATTLVSGNVFRSGAYKCKASNTPKLHLYDADGNELDSFQVVAGLANGQSMGPSADFDGVNLYYFTKKKVTPGAANNYSGAKALGAAFVSESHSAEEVSPDTDLVVTSTWEPLAGSTIAGVKMYYRLAFSNEVEVSMSDSGDGTSWTYAIPSSVYSSARPGSLIRWRFVATDSAGRTTREPAFGSADSSPEYYGTITAPDFECDLPVFHLFVAGPNVGTDLPDDPTDDPRNLAAMDIDSDSLSTASGGAYADMSIGARCSIYHAGHLYDNITIDLRGNTSAGFQKKAHGLKFNKSDKLAYVNPYTGEAGTVRKTSFTAEFMDPSFLRQNVSFQFLNAVGSRAPFHYPVRLQRNGEFYQLGFHSIRFTDEIVDYYGWDDDCELVKNAGSLRTAHSVSGFETKIPEQSNESLPTDNFKALISTFLSPDRSVLAWDVLNIPKWINYMAATRITQECDDVFGNLCVYRHNKTLTWWPAAYDMNLSFGQYYKEAGWGAGNDFWRGEICDEDTFKCHPLYGGSQVRVYVKGTTTLMTVGGVNYNYNGAFDSIYGDAKLRGMHLRRLRTLMDAWLKEPGTPKEDTPIWQFFASQTNAMFKTASLDRAKWRQITSGGVLNIWGGEYGKNFRTNIVEGVNRIWNNYIVPRRQHLYVTHSATNSTYDASSIFTSVEGGVVVCHNAGIPEAQPAGLKVRISRRVLDADGTNTYVKVDNPNAIFLDVSGWTVSDGETTVALDPGTVIPPAGSLYLVADRKAFTAAHPRAQVLLLGNVTSALFTSDAALTVTDADGATAATFAAAPTQPAGETISEDADPFLSNPKRPVIGAASGSDNAPSLPIVKGEGDDGTMYLVIPFAAEAGYTYTLKSATSLMTPVSQWTPVAGVAPITPAADGAAEFRVPMNGAEAFFSISVE
ncbi:MAG: DUF2341 domain-containing protein [Kiritimatiellae bacterium]|nr:DUF2341 domain-containing protein [Kiritimatiellia bacterium]